MPLTQVMITELSESLMKDQVAVNRSFRLSDFKRQGTSTDFNRQASIKNEAYARILYEGVPFHSLLQQSIDAYEDLKASTIDITSALGEYAWLAPYLPLFNAEILRQIIQKHRVDYDYTDESEICLQSMTILMLSYHSHPILFTENPAQFEIIANTWLQTILTFNDIKKPELRSHINDWHDHPFCSTERNLKFMQFCVEVYYKVSKPFADLTGMSKWINRVRAFDELNNVLLNVLKDHEKLNSHAFVEAVRRLQYIQQHKHEFATTTVIDDGSDEIPVAIAVEIPPSAAVVAIASSVEEETMRQAGVELIQSGLSRLTFLAESNHNLQQNNAINRLRLQLFSDFYRSNHITSMQWNFCVDTINQSTSPDKLATAIHYLFIHLLTGIEVSQSLFEFRRDQQWNTFVSTVAEHHDHEKAAIAISTLGHLGLLDDRYWSAIVCGIKTQPKPDKFVWCYHFLKEQRQQGRIRDEQWHICIQALSEANDDPEGVAIGISRMTSGGLLNDPQWEKYLRRTVAHSFPIGCVAILTSLYQAGLLSGEQGNLNFSTVLQFQSQGDFVGLILLLNRSHLLTQGRFDQFTEYASILLYSEIHWCREDRTLITSIQWDNMIQYCGPYKTNPTLEEQVGFLRYVQKEINCSVYSEGYYQSLLEESSDLSAQGLR